MKHGKRPTVEQRKLMEHWHMAPEDWLVERDTPEEMVLRHRHFDVVKRIRKRWEE